MKHILNLNTIWMIFVGLSCSTFWANSVNQPFIQQAETAIGYVSPSTTANDFNAGIAQATNGVTSKSISEVTAGLTAAANANPDETLALMQNGKQFSFEALSPVFSASELKTLCTTILEATGFDSDQVSSSDYATLYSTQGINDDNFETATNLLAQGIQTGNVGDVISALHIINTDSSNDLLLSKLQARLNNPSSTLGTELISKFTANELSQIGAESNNLSFTKIFQARQRFQNDILELNDAFNAKSVTDMVTIISDMNSINPTVTKALFENTEGLNYEFMSQQFSLTDLSQIATAAGLSPSDVTLYVTGNYTSTTAAANQFNTGSGIDAKTLPNGSAYTDLSNAQSEIQKLGGVTEAQAYIKQMQTNVDNWTSQLKAYQEENYDTTQLEQDIATAKGQIENLTNAIDVQTGIEDV